METHPIQAKRRLWDQVSNAVYSRVYDIVESLDLSLTPIEIYALGTLEYRIMLNIERISLLHLSEYTR